MQSRLQRAQPRSANKPRASNSAAAKLPRSHPGEPLAASRFYPCPRTSAQLPAGVCSFPSPGFSTLGCAGSRPRICGCCCSLSPQPPSPFSVASQSFGPNLRVCLFNSSRVYCTGPRARINQHSQESEQIQEDVHASLERRKLQSNLPIAASSPKDGPAPSDPPRDAPVPSDTALAPRHGCQGLHRSGQGKVFAPAVSPGFLGEHELLSPTRRELLAGRQGQACHSPGTFQCHAQPCCPGCRHAALAAPQGRHPLPPNLPPALILS